MTAVHSSQNVNVLEEPGIFLTYPVSIVPGKATPGELSICKEPS